MAQRKQTRQTAPQRKPRRQTAPAKRTGNTKPAKTFSLPKRKPAEFRPDKQGSGWLKKLHITQAQRNTLLKWGSIIVLLVLLLVIQDVIMSQAAIFGTTTDLVVAAILLITVMEGIDTGSVFALLASLLYYFSGSAPGSYAVALLTVLGIGACMFRQLFWHRNLSSIVLCAGLALMLYEICIYGIGIFLGLTYWSRIGAFLGKGLLSWIVMLPLHPLINTIGQIGGNTWKE